MLSFVLIFVLIVFLWRLIRRGVSMASGANLLVDVFAMLFRVAKRGGGRIPLAVAGGLGPRDLAGHRAATGTRSGQNAADGQQRAETPPPTVSFASRPPNGKRAPPVAVTAAPAVSGAAAASTLQALTHAVATPRITSSCPRNAAPKASSAAVSGAAVGHAMIIAERRDGPASTSAGAQAVLRWTSTHP